MGFQMKPSKAPPNTPETGDLTLAFECQVHRELRRIEPDGTGEGADTQLIGTDGEIQRLPEVEKHRPATTDGHTTT